MLQFEWKLGVLHVKMEGALVVKSEVGGADMLPSETLSLRETISRLCARGSCGVQGHGAPPVGSHH